MKKRMKKDAARIAKEEAEEESTHLKKIEKTAKDVAKAAEKHERNRIVKQASKDKEDDDFYFAERKAKELEAKLKEDLKKTDDQKKEEEEEAELKKAVNLVEKKSKSKYSDFSPDDAEPLDSDPKQHADAELEK